MKEDLDILISKRIAQEINNSAKTKTQIAKEVGIALPTLCQYVSGRVQPSLSTFAKLCKSLDISSSDILDI